MPSLVLSLSKDGRACQPWFDKLTTGLVDFPAGVPRPQIGSTIANAGG
jgi:hypothetical protein